jgi:uncharacterized protein (TIGR02266 family)
LTTGPEQQVRLTVEFPDAEAFLNDYRENIQRGRTFVTSRREWTVGCKLRLTLTFPGLRAPVQLPGVVTWVKVGKEPGIGVDLLLDDPPETREKLTRLVERIERSDRDVVARMVRVLIAEDNTLIFEQIQGGLNRLAHRRTPLAALFACRQAIDGAAALEVIQNVPIDMMIVDVNLPVLDGDTLIRSCRELIGPTFPIIAISGGGEDAARRAEKAGADIFLYKPLRLVQVYGAVAQLLGLNDEPPLRAPG